MPAVQHDSPCLTRFRALLDLVVSHDSAHVGDTPLCIHLIPAQRRYLPRPHAGIKRELKIGRVYRIEPVSNALCPMIKSASATVKGSTGFFAFTGSSIEPTGFLVISSSFTAHSNIVCRRWIAERFTVDDFHGVSPAIFRALPM
jgi:hypothetical protein